MRATSRNGRRSSLLIASAALGVWGCTEAEPPARPAAQPTTMAGLPPTRTATAAARAVTPDVPAAPADGAIALAPGAIRHQVGYAYWVRVPDEWQTFASDHADPQRSALVVEEDGVALAPGNAPLEVVQKVGRGSFLHWGGWLYFSSSDNTDPRSNGRDYRAALARAE
jgi:hypothetical protein